MMFAHSRFVGKMTEKAKEESVKENIINDEEKVLQTKICEIAKTLEEDNLTIDVLNSIPNGFMASQLTYYYNVCLNTFNKHVKKGDSVVESIVGLNILSYLSDEKTVVKKSSDANILELLSCYEKESKPEDKAIVYKMIEVAGHIVEALEKANYSAWAKRMRKQSVRAKRCA